MTDCPHFFQTWDFLWTAGWFLGSYIAFDLLFVRWLKLGPRAWKRVDYFWLAGATIGLASAVSTSRTTVAIQELGIEQHRSAVLYQSFTSEIHGMADLCPKWRKNSYVKDAQTEDWKQHNASLAILCTWLIGVSERFPLVASADLDHLPVFPPSEKRPKDYPYPEDWPIDLDALPNDGVLNSGVRAVNDFSIADRINALPEIARKFNVQMDRVRKKTTESQRTAYEQCTAVLAPLLLASALALRFAKVTGELRLK